MTFSLRPAVVLVASMNLWSGQDWLCVQPSVCNQALTHWPDISIHSRPSLFTAAAGAISLEVSHTHIHRYIGRHRVAAKVQRVML